MNRAPSATARPWPWPWRALLILLAVAGLGLGTGNHCIEHAPSATPATALGLAVDITTAVHAPTAGADANTARGSHRGHVHPGVDDRHPVNTVGDCRPASPTAANIVATGASAHLPVLVHTVSRVGSCPPPARPRLVPAITLTQVGVSRT